MSFLSALGLECSSTCKPSNPATTTVKVNMDDLASSAPRDACQPRELSEEEVRQKMQADLAAKMEQVQAEREKEEARLRAEEEARQAAMEAKRLAEQERLKEQARVAEEMQRRREAEEAAQRAAEAAAAKAAWEAAEQERVRQKQAEAERKKVVSAYLKQHGFTGVNSKKSSLMSSTYPLHKAAEAGDDKVVNMLLLEGADSALKNSSGKTAAQVAEKKNKKGSHAQVLASLTMRSAQDVRCGGA